MSDEETPYIAGFWRGLDKGLNGAQAKVPPHPKGTDDRRAWLAGFVAGYRFGLALRQEHQNTEDRLNQLGVQAKRGRADG